jgi:hypothetical protein
MGYIRDMRGITIHFQGSLGRPVQLELKDILVALGPAACAARWICDAVECIGPGAEALHRLSDDKRSVGGDSLLRIANEVDQTIDGYFRAFRKAGRKPWLVIRAVEGDFDVYSYDDAVFETLAQHFPYITDHPSERAAQTTVTSAEVTENSEWTQRKTVRLDNSLSAITESLRRIQTEGAIQGNFVIFEAEVGKRPFVQFMVNSDKTLYAEAVGDDTEYPLTPEQKERLRAMGWNPSQYVPALTREWSAHDDMDRLVIARAVVLIFAEVYGVALSEPLQVDLRIV